MTFESQPRQRVGKNFFEDIKIFSPAQESQWNTREKFMNLRAPDKRDAFQELFTGGYSMAGDLDDQTNLPMFWFQSEA